MRRILVLLSFAALLLPSAWTSVEAQSGQVEIRNFTGFVHPIRKIVRLVWWASEDSLFATQIVQHSKDGLNFTDIGEVPALLTGEDGHIYDFWHLNPEQGLNYYRLHLVFTHDVEYDIDPIKVEVGAPPIFSYPTYPSRPRPGATPLTGEGDQWTEAMITDIHGRPVMSVEEPTDLNTIDLPMGIYILNARYQSGWKTSTLVINQE